MLGSWREIIDTFANKQEETVGEILPRASESEPPRHALPAGSLQSQKTQQHLKVQTFNHSAIQQIWTWLEKMRVSSREKLPIFH